jgi:beta-phosphoglucomutase-like phosphatase (HAD superfamily)
MAGYLFQLELSELTDKVTACIPAHREHINRLFSQGRILSYSVSVSRNMIWCVVNAEDQPEAMEMVLQFPLYDYFTDVACHPLLFHNVLPATLPGISLN